MNFPKKPRKIKEVYLDNAAATKVDSEVFAAMLPFFERSYANPSALYKSAKLVSDQVTNAKKTCANLISAREDEIIFTSGGTESCNLAILGVARKYRKENNSGGHIITTAVEHHAVLEPLKKLEDEGFEVTYLSVDESGKLSLEEFKKALRKDTFLVTIMYANNEVGTIYPIADIGREILKFRKKNNIKYPLLHTDACQIGGSATLDVEKLHVDLLTVNGSKIYGPKGSGMLFVRRGINIEPLQYGGGQEYGKRSGTENVPALIGFAKALEKVISNSEFGETAVLRDYLYKGLEEKVLGITLNGPELSTERLPGNLHISIEGVEAESLVLYASSYGIYFSVGSACTTGSDESSHVLKAMGLSDKRINTGVRLTLGTNTTKKEIDYILKYLPQIIDAIRSMSEIS